VKQQPVVTADGTVACHCCNQHDVLRHAQTATGALMMFIVI